jgi:hypothetical protein
VPAPYDRPSVIDLLPAAPRVLPVSQEIERGPEEDRGEMFWRGIQQSMDVGRMHGMCGIGPEKALDPWIYRDRRLSGRRHRPGWEDDEGPQEPYTPSFHGADFPPESYVTGVVPTYRRPRDRGSNA